MESVPPGLGNMPPEIQERILLKTDAATILNFCQINKQFADLCDKEAFWMNKLEHDFGVVRKPERSTWKQTYFQVVKGLESAIVIYQGNEFGVVWFKGNFSLRTILETAAKFLPVPIRIDVFYLTVKGDGGDLYRITPGSIPTGTIVDHIKPPAKLVKIELSPLEREVKFVGFETINFFVINVAINFLPMNSTIDQFLRRIRESIPLLSRIFVYDDQTDMLTEVPISNPSANAIEVISSLRGNGNIPLTPEIMNYMDQIQVRPEPRYIFFFDRP